MKKRDLNKKVKMLLKERSHINLNLGCGEEPQRGFINVDMLNLPGVDVVWDLEEYPWPFPENSIDLIVASQLVEHVNPHKGNFIKFMDEAWRVLKVHGQFMLATPYAGSMGYFQDPTHCNPCNEYTWEYFDPISPMTKGALYLNYRPKPWKIVENSWYQNGNLEVLLEKRPDDKSYHPPESVEIKDKDITDHHKRQVLLSSRERNERGK